MVTVADFETLCCGAAARPLVLAGASPWYTGTNVLDFVAALHCEASQVLVEWEVSRPGELEPERARLPLHMFLQQALPQSCASASVRLEAEGLLEDVSERLRMRLRPPVYCAPAQLSRLVMAGTGSHGVRSDQLGWWDALLVGTRRWCLHAPSAEAVPAQTQLGALQVAGDVLFVPPGWRAEDAVEGDLRTIGAISAYMPAGMLAIQQAYVLAPQVATPPCPMGGLRLDVAVLLTQLRAARALQHDERSRSGLRVINLREKAPERRELMQETCVGPLLGHGVDADFWDGVVGRELPLDTELMLGGAQEIEACGYQFVVDTTCYRHWLDDELALDLERRFFALGFDPGYWLGFREHAEEPMTFGYVGGYMSHSTLWRAAYEHLPLWDWVLICEDDAMMVSELGLKWPDVWDLVAAQVVELRSRREAWDILYVGRQAPKTPDVGEVSPLLARAGFGLCTHSYALSREGLRKLLGSLMSTTMLHVPQDVIFASLAFGDHPNARLSQRIKEIGPQEKWRALSFKTRDPSSIDPRGGLTTQLGAMEHSRRANSQCQDFIDGRPSMFQLAE